MEHENYRKKEPKKCLDATQEAPTLLGAGGNYLDNGANLDLWQTEKKKTQKGKAHLASIFLFAPQMSQSRLHPRVLVAISKRVAAHSDSC